MLEKIIEWSSRNRFMVVLATIILIIGGIYSLRNIAIDAIPDLSDVQVIIYTEYPGQAPQVVEDQVTYPLTTRMLSVPGAKDVRGYSFFGYSFVYIIFEDGTDIYWARSRVLEYLNYAAGQLPRDVTPTLGPDATGVGWVYSYALTSDRHDLQELRSIQDWYLRYELAALDGVSEVASLGGFVKQYQVVVDPNKLIAYDLPITDLMMAIQRSNVDVGGGAIEMAETEFMVRSRGYIQSVEDLEQVVVMATEDGTPILVRDLAEVRLGPEMRRGLAELDGEGEVVGGIIVMRFGENARQVIQRVKDRLEELKPGLPEGVEVVMTYDRSDLIDRSVDHLQQKLVEEMLIVALVIILFLFHLPSAAVIIVSLPIAVLMSFIVMYAMGINANIMSLGGIAIAIGTMVDSGIIMVENAHKKIERYPDKPRSEVIIAAAKEVGPTIFFALLVIAAAFAPVFALQEQAGRLFKPLAFTKTFSIAAAAFLSITLVPVLMMWFIRGRVRPENQNPINRFLNRIYHPAVHFVLRWRKITMLVALLLVLSIAYPISKIGTEFMPPLYEGDLLYMPTTLPGLSVTKARELLQQTDKIIASFPEVDRVFGKIGRAETATDPAPMMMIETTILLKPEDQWRTTHVHRFYTDWPDWTEILKKPLRWVWPEEKPISVDKLIDELNEAVHFPGLTNAWTMPIRTRIDMLSTGIRTPVGIKVMGDDLEVLARLGEEIETVVRPLPGTLSAIAERTVGGYYLDIDIDRRAAARYGINVGDIQDVVQAAIGGMNISETVEGLERYPINVRYDRDFRSDPEALRRVLVPAPGGRHIPLGQLVEINIINAPDSIKSENARRTAWVYVDIRDIDVGTYVENARRAVADNITLPPGYSIVWSGQYEYIESTRERLMLILPLTVIAIFVLIFISTRSVVKTLIVFMGVPISLVGAFWLLYALDYNMSVAVWVGLIAMAGLDAETGTVMLLYLDLARDKWAKHGRLKTRGDLIQAVHYGAVKRIRPKIMTVVTIIVALLPIMWSTGAGADVMKRVAAPMVGGAVSSLLIELLLYPVVYFAWRARGLDKSMVPTSELDIDEEPE
ncbi:efflux RND transporter permease subunit [Geoalkalibacter halelectricus]|uniref:CusA/CzcA family heavy metal efflux RND transporter n=1 Tax=Geoalkalibacter halelectricus TaxID=2847045 RepID=A0ABY5ZN72_9BACT|nr:CusA/CzcA family heavy metal efflux RND transporter [Geoalkalibacter halelectricus]MDO3379907.1 CusA/CzcA family heavy metal efflux RND transporter [Geoalkalibacter halelectricus]UWZ80566.1 CusA/CzcA family heavy metal efflux RND transporter [Geoalkalibacter halelectricus]